MNNLTRVQSIFISDGTALPADNSASTAVTAGKIGIFGKDWTALNPAGGDTITTQPSIYIVEGKTDSGGTNYLKKSTKIDGMNVISYTGKSYAPTVRKAFSIGYSRKAAVGSIEVNNSTFYKFTVNFKNDKTLYAARPEQLTASFVSASNNTQLATATTIAGIINASAWKRQIVAVVVGDGTGAYGVTGASNYGVEMTSLSIDQFTNSTYTANEVYFSVQVDDSTGFGTTTTCTSLTDVLYGNGTYNQIFNIENKDFGYEGTTNRRLWPIPVLDYSSVSTLIPSVAIAETSATTVGSDLVTFSATVAAKIRTGEEVTLDGVNYKIKYFISTTVAILTSVATTTTITGAVLVRFKYDTVTIEYNDRINTPTGVSALSNKSVIIAVPSIVSGAAYNSTGTAATAVKAILDAWMTTTPAAFANITI